ncbi:MAG: hypothetical protein WCH34_18715 [Bacteroidota bacterium]
MKSEKDLKDIRVSTFSNGNRWKTPVLDIACASFLYSACAPNVAGIQYDSQIENQEEIENLCSEISLKVYELHKLINTDNAIYS